MTINGSKNLKKNTNKREILKHALTTNEKPEEGSEYELRIYEIK